MTLLQPQMLWGIAALIVPIAIHFWYQRRGKLLLWAATRWLGEKTNLSHKGIRLDEIPLLILRCIMFLILVAFFCKPMFSLWKTNKAKIHLVEGDQGLIDNFRFELQKALSADEKVYMVGKQLIDIKDITPVKELDQSIFLQNNISQLADGESELHLYIRNRQSLAGLPEIVVPGPFRLHDFVDSSANSLVNFIEGKNEKIIYVDSKNGALTVNDKRPSDPDSKRFAARHRGPITVLLAMGEAHKNDVIEAALQALQEVYFMPVTISQKREVGKYYDLEILKNRPDRLTASTLYLLEDVNNENVVFENVISFPDSLNAVTSDFVSNGRLPEWIGQQLVAYFGLVPNNSPLSKQAFDRLFRRVSFKSETASGNRHRWLLPVFLLTLLIERWLVLRNQTRYADA